LSVVYGGKRCLYAIDSKTDTKKLFDEILSQIPDYKELNRLKERFNETINSIR